MRDRVFFNAWDGRAQTRLVGLVLNWSIFLDIVEALPDIGSGVPLIMVKDLVELLDSVLYNSNNRNYCKVALNAYLKF